MSPEDAKKLSETIDVAIAQARSRVAAEGSSQVKYEYDPYLDELSPARLRSLRFQAFIRFLVDVSKIATPILLFLILQKMG